MVLHISIDGIQNKEQVKALQKHFTSKKYNVAVAEPPKLIKNRVFNNHEWALLSALERSNYYYNNDWSDFDMVFWTNSIVFDFISYADNKTPATFIKQVNKYFPQMDCFIVILNNRNSDEDLDELIKIKKPLVKTYFDGEDASKLTEDLIKLIHEHLPKCEWCGRIFQPTQKHKKYCTTQCAEYSLEEQYRVNNRNYYNRYKDVMSEQKKGEHGSKEANLHGKADTNPIRELEKVRNAKKALGLKNIQ